MSEKEKYLSMLCPSDLSADNSINLPVIECVERVNAIKEIQFMSREEAIARYGMLPIPCTMNGMPCEVLMIRKDGTVYGLPLDAKELTPHAIKLT